MRKFFLIILSVYFVNQAEAQWTQTNGPFIGTVNCIDTVGGKMYAGTAWGMFRSLNNGLTWQIINTGIPWGSSVTTIFSINNNSSGIFIGTDAGIYFSSNEGLSWSSPVSSGSDVLSLEIFGDTIFAGNTYIPDRSYDNGLTWTSIGSGIPTFTAVYAMKKLGSVMFAGTSSGLYKSLNYGASWTPIPGAVSLGAVRSLVIDGANFYAATFAGIFVSTDLGITWTAINTGLTTSAFTSITAAGTILFAGAYNGNVFFSANGGLSWTNANLNFGNTMIMSCFYEGGNIHVGTDNGIYVSSDNGLTWNATGTGLANCDAMSVFSYGSTVFTGVESKGVFKTTNYGESWTKTMAGLPVSPSQITEFTSYGSRLFAFIDCNVYMSSDTGSSWTLFNNSLPTCIRPFVRQGSSLFAIANYGLYESTDSADSWTLINPSISCSKIVISGSTMYGILPPSVVSKSIDNGVTWTLINAGLIGASAYNQIYDIDVDGADIYVSGQRLSAGTIYHSNNDGATWNDIDTPSGVIPGCLNAVPALIINGSNIYAAGSGVYLSKDNGTNWTLDGPLVTGSCFGAFQAFNFNKTDIFAVAYGHGVWMSPLIHNVWPGDANNDNIANNTDLLPIGLYYGETGTSRASLSNTWLPYSSMNWGTTQSNGSDIKYADCNGDGTINMSDTLAINLNYSSVHAISSQGNDQYKQVAPNIYLVTGSFYYPGDWVDVEVWIGNSSIPVDSLYGIAFDINYNSSLVQAGSESLIYPNSWLGTVGTDAIKISKIDAMANKCLGAIVRIDHNNSSGYGKIADFTFKLKNTISSNDSIQLLISNYTAVIENGTGLIFNSIPTTIQISVGVSEYENETNFHISPNPYIGTTQIKYSLIKESFVTLEVFNSVGQKIQTLVSKEQSLGEYKYDFSAEQKGYDAGVYFVKMTIGGKSIMKKLVEIK